MPAGVNSVAAWAAEPCEPSMAAVVTPVNAPWSSIAWAPIQRPARTRCSQLEPSGYSNEGERVTKLLPMKP